jgi:hypothetical protein
MVLSSSEDPTSHGSDRWSDLGQLYTSREERSSVGQTSYDVFMSFSGADRSRCRVLAAELRAQGLRVFVDEDSIDHFKSISMQIELALASSKVLVAYYSRDYASRPACQLELIAAFLAGQREEDPCGRILVVNPEPTVDHLLPVELADARYALPPRALGELSDLAGAIRSCVESIRGTIGEVSFAYQPRWFARRHGMTGYVGEYRELWAVHSALHAADFPLTQERSCGWTVSVCGMAGPRRSCLAAAYAYRFGAAFKGGVYWIDLVDAGGATSTVVNHYVQLAKRIGHMIGVDVDALPADRVVGLIADQLVRKEGQSLWIVENVPSGFAPTAVDSLVLPAGPKVRTLILSDENIFDSVLPVVDLGEVDKGKSHTTSGRPVTS